MEQIELNCMKCGSVSLVGSNKGTYIGKSCCGNYMVVIEK